MILFHADLDNTLIYSHKRDIGGDRIGVERYEGRTVSYMTPESLRRLKELSRRVLFVPTTTMTAEQYERIRFGIGTPRYALVCNGGVLICEGKEEKEWYEESRMMAESSQTELALAEEYLEQDADRSFEVRNVRGLFVFTKSRRPERTAAALRDILDSSGADVFRNGVKVYVMPKVMSKGNAVKRLKERLMRVRCVSSPWYVIAAGDSGFDLSMAAESDLFFAPDTLRDAETCSRTEIFRPGAERIFSDYLLRRVSEIVSERAGTAPESLRIASERQREDR